MKDRKGRRATREREKEKKIERERKRKRERKAEKREIKTKRKKIERQQGKERVSKGDLYTHPHYPDPNANTRGHGGVESKLILGFRHLALLNE